MRGPEIGTLLTKLYRHFIVGAYRGPAIHNEPLDHINTWRHCDVKYLWTSILFWMPPEERFAGSQE